MNIGNNFETNFFIEIDYYRTFKSGWYQSDKTEKLLLAFHSYRYSWIKDERVLGRVTVLQDRYSIEL